MSGTGDQGGAAGLAAQETPRGSPSSHGQQLPGPSGRLPANPGQSGDLQSQIKQTQSRSPPSFHPLLSRGAPRAVARRGASRRGRGAGPEAA